MDSILKQFSGVSWEVLWITVVFPELKDYF